MCGVGQTCCSQCPDYAHQKGRQQARAGSLRLQRRSKERLEAWLQNAVFRNRVLDAGDRFWLEAMADAVLIVSPVYGRRGWSPTSAWTTQTRPHRSLPTTWRTAVLRPAHSSALDSSISIRVRPPR